jgi:spore coat protein CotH
VRNLLKHFLAVIALVSFLPSTPAQPTSPSLDAADDFFGRSTVEKVQIWVHPDDWQKLRDNYLTNDYYPALLIWRDQWLEPVGIRSRGRGSRNPLKPGLRVDFNRYEKLELLGLSGLVLDNMTQDPPQLREATAMALYRQMGVPAPRTLYVRLEVNGEPAGLYLAEEEIGKPFLERHFQETKGDLFEYSWGDMWHWEPRGELPDSYVPVPFSPKTHEQKPNVAALMELVARLNAADPVEANEQLADLIDWDEVLRYLAVDWYSGDHDGFAGDFATNNFYIYRANFDKKWRLIPWDKDATFIDKDYPLFPLDETGIENRWITLIRNNPQLMDKFVEYCREAIVLGSGWLPEQAELLRAVSFDYAVRDSFRPAGLGPYENALNEFFYFLRERPAAALLALESINVPTPPEVMEPWLSPTSRKIY